MCGEGVQGGGGSVWSCHKVHIYYIILYYTKRTTKEGEGGGGLKQARFAAKSFCRVSLKGTPNEHFGFFESKLINGYMRYKMC